MAKIATMQSELSFQPTYGEMTDWRKALCLYESYRFAVTGLFPVGRNRMLRVHEMDAVLTASRSLTPRVVGRESGSSPSPCPLPVSRVTTATRLRGQARAIRSSVRQVHQEVCQQPRRPLPGEFSCTDGPSFRNEDICALSHQSFAMQSAREISLLSPAMTAASPTTSCTDRSGEITSGAPHASASRGCSPNPRTARVGRTSMRLHSAAGVLHLRCDRVHVVVVRRQSRERYGKCVHTAPRGCLR